MTEVRRAAGDLGAPLLRVSARLRRRNLARVQLALDLLVLEVLDVGPDGRARRIGDPRYIDGAGLVVLDRAHGPSSPAEFHFRFNGGQMTVGRGNIREAVRLIAEKNIARSA